MRKRTRVCHLPAAIAVLRALEQTLPSSMWRAPQDRASLEIAHRVAKELRLRPQMLDLAHQNLDRWSARNHDSPGLLRCYDEWRSLLQRPIEEICEALTRTDSEGQRLRQNSPFAGVLPPQEIWRIKREVRLEHDAA